MAASPAADSSAVFAFLRPGMDGMCGIETVGMETVGIETDGKLDGSQPETLPVTLENIPPAAFVGLKGSTRGEYCYQISLLQSTILNL